MTLKHVALAPVVAGAALFATALSARSAEAVEPVSAQSSCNIELIVLGAGQDAGAPQIGNSEDAGPRLFASSLALVDRTEGKRYLFDAAPDITRQLQMLDKVAPPEAGAGLGIDGVFLTHAHIGHYLGLAYLGKEAANARGVPVHAMPRMAEFLRSNGPWSQLVSEGNITLSALAPETFTVLSDEIGVLPILVPHRDEFSETVGFLIMTPDKRALYVPDLDSWDEYTEESGSSLEKLVAGVDYAFIDATFWDDNELLGRDMSAIPHPRVAKVMDRLQSLPASARRKVHFIHYNHTNAIRDPASAQSREVEARGYHVARRGMRVCLSERAGD